jgi:hypothetical protein
MNGNWTRKVVGVVMACLKSLRWNFIEEFNEIARPSFTIIMVPTERFKGRSEYEAQQDKQCT